MINAVGREIPEELLVNGKEVYQGKFYMDGKYMQKAAPKTRRYEKPAVTSIHSLPMRSNAFSFANVLSSVFFILLPSFPNEMPTASDTLSAATPRTNSLRSIFCII